jgi:hypothetical protein
MYLQRKVCSLFYIKRCRLDYIFLKMQYSSEQFERGETSFIFLGFVNKETIQI